MKKVLLLPVVCASAFAQTDYVLDIAEPTKNVVGVSYTAWAGKLVVNVDGANPEDIGADPASSSFTVPDVIYGAKSGSVFTSNRDNASGGVLQPGIAAMTFNMNSGVIKSFIGAVESSKIYGDVEMNVRGGLIYTKPGEYDILATALSPTDSASSGVAIYGDSKLNFGSSSVSGQPRIYGSVFAMGAGTLHGDTHVNISGGTYGSYNISIGVFAGSAWGGVINGSTNLHITGGDFSEAYVYGGSFGEDSTQMSLIKGSTNVTIDGGKFSTVYSGNYKFANLAISGDANMTVNSGDFENAYGGGGTVGGDVRTEINGGTIGSAFGNYGNVFGDSVLVLNGGIVGKAYAASYGNIQGTSTLRVNGGTVTVEGELNLLLGENSWGGINVDTTNGPAGVTFADGSAVNMTGSDQNVIYIDEDNDADLVTITGAEEAGLAQDADGNYVIGGQGEDTDPSPEQPGDGEDEQKPEGGNTPEDGDQNADDTPVKEDELSDNGASGNGEADDKKNAEENMKKAPQTGDNSTGLYIALAALLGSGTAAGSVLKKRRELMK